MRFTAAATAAALVAGISAAEYGNAPSPVKASHVPVPIITASYAPAPSPVHPAGNQTVVYATEVVTSFTTFCPSPTTFVHGTQTITVTEATTLTITDCPCTITRPILTSVVVDCPSGKECPAPSPAPPAVTTPVVVVPKPTAPAVETPEHKPEGPVSPVKTPEHKPEGPVSPVQPVKPLTPSVQPGKPVTPPPATNGTVVPIQVTESGASKALVASGAGLAGLFAIIAYLL